ncbi:hypothetical protein Vadar_030482 [Vaccinium darrowii]|uniref:Uncharacterized protein n=1 Tax=Vaccinium darrowii TaxID=229202 RepID=A0ACB7XVV6_9ERIC|nr:hypothetical protein Vadar_030482 [Vaccinium darrowii]
MMARKCTFSLAVPVLGSIYCSLKQISSSPTPNQCNAILPMHYVCGWLGNYFDTYHPSAHTFPSVRMVRLAGDHMAKHFIAATAHNLLRSVNLLQLSSLSLSTRDELLIVDDGAQSHSRMDYVISLRSSNLTLRRVKEYVVEPYIPHRFLRQFDFCQDIPGKLVEEACPINLPDVAGLWQSCTKLGKAKPSRTKQSKAKDTTKDAPNGVERSIPKARTLLKIPTPKLQSIVVKDPIVENGRKKRSLKFVTERAALAMLGIDNLNLEDEVNSQSSEDSIDGPAPCPLVTRRKRVEQEPHQGDELISSCQRKYVSSLWVELSDKIGKSRLNHVHTIEEEAEKIIQEMSKMNQVDISPLQNNLQNFFKKVQEYNSARSSSSEKMHEEEQSHQLASASQRLSATELKEGEINKEFQLCQHRFASIEAKEAQLKRELKELGVKRKEVEVQLLAHEKELSKLQADVSCLKEEVSTSQNAAVQSDADIENLEQMKNLLEALQKELADFKLFPYCPFFV